MTENEEFMLRLCFVDCEALKLITDIVKRKGMMAAEIGSWCGNSTLIIANKIMPHEGTLFAIDHWQGSPRSKTFEWAKEKDIYATFKERMVKNNVWSVIKPMVMDSLTAARIFKDSSLDMVFIDADHRYKQVKQDILAWLPKVRQGGIICGHDCERYYKSLTQDIKDEIEHRIEEECILINHYKLSLHPGVIKAVYEIFGDKYNITQHGVVWHYKVV